MRWRSAVEAHRATRGKQQAVRGKQLADLAIRPSIHQRASGIVAVGQVAAASRASVKPLAVSHHFISVYQQQQLDDGIYKI
jgi:hypothetical protein